MTLATTTQRELLVDCPEGRISWMTIGDPAQVLARMATDLSTCNALVTTPITNGFTHRVGFDAALRHREDGVSLGWTLYGEFSTPANGTRMLALVQLARGDPRTIVAAWLPVLAAVCMQPDLHEPVADALATQLMAWSRYFWRAPTAYQPVATTPLAWSDTRGHQLLADLHHTWRAQGGPMVWPDTALGMLTMLELMAASAWEHPDYFRVTSMFAVPALRLDQTMTPEERQLVDDTHRYEVGAICYPSRAASPTTVRGFTVPPYAAVLRVQPERAYLQWAFCHGGMQMAPPATDPHAVLDPDLLRWLVGATTIALGVWPEDVSLPDAGWAERARAGCQALAVDAADARFAADGVWDIPLPHAFGGAMGVMGITHLRVVGDVGGLWVALLVGAHTPAQVVFRWQPAHADAWHMLPLLMGEKAATEACVIAAAVWRDLRCGGPQVFHQRPGGSPHLVANQEPRTSGSQQRGRAVGPQVRAVRWGNEDDQHTVTAIRQQVPHAVRACVRRLPNGGRASRQQQQRFADVPLAIRMQIAHAAQLPPDRTFVPSHLRGITGALRDAMRSAHAQGLVAVALLLHVDDTADEYEGE